MDADELFRIVGLGETFTVQFKEKMPHRDSIATEMVAMANSSGGMILFGIEDATNRIVGLSSIEIEEYDRIVSQIADGIAPEVRIRTEVVDAGNGGPSKNILIVHVPEGMDKPYKTDNGEIYVKQGANKRRVLDNGELMRMFQESRKLFADEMEVYGTAIEDIDKVAFSAYFVKEFGVPFEGKGLTYESALRAKRVMRNAQATLAGLLFFGLSPQSVKPMFTVKVVSFFGNDIGGSHYRSKPADLQGTVPELFAKSMDWLKGNLKSVQDGQDFNSIGRLEINEEALVELVENALIHRDYFKPAPIRILLFDDRLEIISPGRLPNSLTVEEMKYGNTIVRNPLIAGFAMRTMPFSGLGTGINRALERQPDIELLNDAEGDQFKIVIPRKPL
ncbi:MAG: putative DNA binding domain-containing protein [Victivallales bacterium]|nr:putative DNA binding domain-containing protein [Victivallales bacterium]